MKLSKEGRKLTMETNKNLVELLKKNGPMVRARELKKLFVGLAQSTLGKWVSYGLITRYKIGGSVFYKLNEIEDLIEKSADLKEVG
jgi:hypothetical protein